MVTAKDIRGGRIDYSSARRTSIEAYRNLLTDKSRPRVGDLLLTKDGSIGRVAICDRADVCINQSVALLQLKETIDARFLAYLLQAPTYQERMGADADGSTIQHIYITRVDKMPIRVPDLTTQYTIADVLGALDDKIAANTELANAIDGLCEALLHRFRGHGDTTLARIATVNGETVKPGRGDLRYLDISSVSTGGYSWPAPIPWAEAPGRARRLVKAGDTVWSTVRPNRRSHALVLDEGLIGSTGLAVITPTTAGPAFVYEATKTAEFTAYLEAVAEGSAYPAVRAERFLQAPVPNVGTEARERFESVAFPARLRAHAAAVESRRLASLRDSLLPHLMSGRITVREAEKTVEEVL